MERRPPERRSIASRADDVLLLVVVGVVALVAWQVASAVVGTVVFVLKLAVVVLAVAVAARFVLRRR